jgi:acetyl-CoA carboxylase carboxyltransferase component
MSDYVIMQRGAAKVFLGGPPLVKMAIDEDADEEELGGAEMHARVSGLADYLAVDERDALRQARDVVAHLNWRKAGPGPSKIGAPPKYDAAELLGLVSMDVRQPFDSRDVLARLLDSSEFEEFKPLYGSTLVTGWGSLHGYPIGVLANNGILFSEEAEKGAQFIQLCNRHEVPILFCQNITGFMVGTRYERGGIIKDGAKLINAVSNSTVPHLTLMMGASYGAGNYGMSGRAYAPRFIFTWPNHRIAVMGPKQLAGVLTIVAKSRAEKTGIPWDDEAFAPMRDAFEQQVEKESTALFATGRMWDDGIVDPRQTRDALGIALSAIHSGPVEGTSNFGVFRM